MKPHQIIFDKISTILKTHFKERIKLETDKYNDRYQEEHLYIDDSDIWISCDDRELIFGSGFNHRHINPEYDNLQDGVNELINLLTKRKRITKYYKGKICFKVKAEIEVKNSKYEQLSTSLTWLYPFWKPTNQEILFVEKLIDLNLIEEEIKEIKNYAQKVSKTLKYLSN